MTQRKSKLTIAALHESLKPPNNCRVAAFMDELNSDERAVLEEALAIDPKEYKAGQVVDLLKSAGFTDHPLLPGVDAITNHRAGRRPCRCKG